MLCRARQVERNAGMKGAVSTVRTCWLRLRV
jgi:hypothetical protein